jgi:hypothetical protein
MTAVQVGTGTPVLPVPRPAADDVAATAAPGAAPESRAGAYQRLLHRVVGRELHRLGELLGWAPAAEPARTRTLTAHADLVGRLLLAHHRFEREVLWPALLAAVPAGRAAGLRSAVADWTVRTAVIDAQVRDLATAARQWAVVGTPAARDALALGCRRLADAVAESVAAEERDLVPLLDAHLDTDGWTAVAATSPCRLSARERQVVLGLALEDCCPGDRARVIRGLPPRRRLAWRLVGVRRYRAAVVRLRGAPPAR